MRRDDLSFLGRSFETQGELVSLAPHGSGHIHDTFAATYRQPSGRVRYIHQRLNTFVFEDPLAVLENVARVTSHIRRRLEDSGTDQIDRRVLTLVPTLDGKPYLCGPEGRYWRTYLFVEGTHTRDQVDSIHQAYDAARAFGEFQSLLADLPPPPLKETIVDFHETPARLHALEEAIREDAFNRCHEAKADIAFIEENTPLVYGLREIRQTGAIPERIVHNDTKINNLLIDDETHEGICVIDLDTVMPGLSLHDFGDMARTASSSAAEDERDLSKVEVRRPIFKALVEGYLSAAGSFLSPREKDLLVFAAQLITIENAIRFLTDFLTGDAYFKTHRPGQNLDRCRTHLQLLRSLRRNETALQRMVEQAGDDASPR